MPVAAPQERRLFYAGQGNRQALSRRELKDLLDCALPQRAYLHWWKSRSKRPAPVRAWEGTQMTEEISMLDAFDIVTEEEILCLWRSLNSKGLSEREAWDAIVTGLALEMAFDRSKNFRPVEQ